MRIGWVALVSLPFCQISSANWMSDSLRLPNAAAQKAIVDQSLTSKAIQANTQADAARAQLDQVKQIDALRTEAQKLLSEATAREQALLQREADLKKYAIDLDSRNVALAMEKEQTEYEKRRVELRELIFSGSTVGLGISTLLALMGLLINRRSTLLDIEKKRLEIDILKRSNVPAPV